MAQRALNILWPAFVMAGVLETLVFVVVDPLELHWQVSALCFFIVSNRATFSKIFGRDSGAPQFLWRGVERSLDALPSLRRLHAGQQFTELRYSKYEFGHECLARMDNIVKFYI